MLERQGKQSADPNLLAKVYHAQLEQLEQWMAGLACFAVLPVQHRDVISSPAELAGEIAQFLGGDLDVARMAGTVDPALYRERLGA